MPPRPKTGWLAWEATTGYIVSHHSPDATLKLIARPSSDKTISWSASLTWGTSSEVVNDQVALGVALAELWRKVQQHHQIFETLEAAIRRPAGYSDETWITAQERETIDRILKVNWTVFGTNWQLVILYQPVDRPQDRVHARLMAKDNAVLVGARGETLQVACRALFRNAARIYQEHRED